MDNMKLEDLDYFSNSSNGTINESDYEYVFYDTTDDSYYTAFVKNFFEFSSYLGLLGNLLMVIVFSKRPRIQPPDYFLLNLAIIDLLYASGLIIQVLMDVFASNYQFYSLTCISLNLFYYFLIVPTLYSLGMMTLERIVLVVNIRLYRKMVTKHNIIITFIVIYTISAIAIIPNTLTHCLYDIQPLFITYLFQGHILLLASIVSTLMITLCVIYCRILKFGRTSDPNPAEQVKEAPSTFTNLTEKTSTRRNSSRIRSRSVWFLLKTRHNGMPHDMTNLSVVNNMHGRVVISPLRPDVIERQARHFNSSASSANSSTQQPLTQVKQRDIYEVSCLAGSGSEVTAKIGPQSSPIASDSNAPSSVSNDKKTFYLLTAISGLFILLYWPNIIATALYNLRISPISTTSHLWVFIIVNRLSLLHTLVNPLTSLVISSRFRSETRQLFSKVDCCSRSNSTSSA